MFLIDIIEDRKPLRYQYQYPQLSPDNETLPTIGQGQLHTVQDGWYYYTAIVHMEETLV